MNSLFNEMTAFDDESFLADVKSSITAVPSLLKQWLDGFKDPVDRAKALLTRCKRASLLFRAGDDSYDAERRELRHLLIREINELAFRFILAVEDIAHRK